MTASIHFAVPQPHLMLGLFLPGLVMSVGGKGHAALTASFSFCGHVCFEKPTCAEHVRLTQVILPLGEDPKEKRNGLKAKQNNTNSEEGRVVTGLTGENVCIRRSPDLQAVRKALQVWKTALVNSSCMALDACKAPRALVHLRAMINPIGQNGNAFVTPLSTRLQAFNGIHCCHKPNCVYQLNAFSMMGVWSGVCRL